MGSVVVLFIILWGVIWLIAESLKEDVISDKTKKHPIQYKIEDEIQAKFTLSELMDEKRRAADQGLINKYLPYQEYYKLLVEGGCVKNNVPFNRYFVHFTSTKSR